MSRGIPIGCLSYQTWLLKASTDVSCCMNVTRLSGAVHLHICQGEDKTASSIMIVGASTCKPCSLI